MSKNSLAGNIGKGAVGFGVGFALYYLIRSLGFGLGVGNGRGDGRGDDERAERLEQIARAEIERMTALTPAAIPPDSERLLFRLKSREPSTSGPPLLILDGQTYPLATAITRVKLGKRKDVDLLVPGDVRQGDFDASMEEFRRAGIEPHVREPRGVVAESPRVSGNARGQYGRA